MPPDAIIFDIDGTLWDASAASAEGWNNALAKLGIERIVTPKEIAGVSGHPYDQCIDILLPGLVARYPGLRETINQCEDLVVRTRSGVFYEGALTGIKTLARRNKIFLVSNCQEWYLRLFFGFSGLEPALIGYDCYGMSGLNKGEMLKKIGADYSLEHPVYIGDTAGDETAAREAGMKFFHVSYGFGTATKKAETFDSFAELVDYFLGLKKVKV
ncbi:MAG: HAD family hydrolase [Patescibacteria group bacterium]